MAPGAAWCLLVSVCLPLAHSLYFHMWETDVKCFVEEVPDETMISGKYKVEVYEEQTESFVTKEGIGMHVEVKDPEKKQILSKYYMNEGQFVFTTHTPGEHYICLSPNSTRWFTGGARLRVHLGIDVGEHANDYKQIQAKEKLSELQLRVRQLLEQVEQITKEQNYQRVREERFRFTSESTNTRVLWWAVCQTCILLIVGYWQMRHLKGFFEAKKLV